MRGASRYFDTDHLAHTSCTAFDRTKGVNMQTELSTKNTLQKSEHTKTQIQDIMAHLPQHISEPSKAIPFGDRTKETRTMNIGYIRVSSRTQNPERQIVKLRELGIEERFLFIDRASGKNFERAAWQAMLLVLREGDCLYIDSLDRLGRSYDGVTAEWKRITREVGADIIALDKADIFDSRKFRAQGDIGKLLEDIMLSTLAYVAETERTKIRQRQREGIDLAMAHGRMTGRPRVQYDRERFAALYENWKHGEISAAECMRELNLKSQTFYRRAREHEAQISSTHQS